MDADLRGWEAFVGLIGDLRDRCDLLLSNLVPVLPVREIAAQSPFTFHPSTRLTLAQGRPFTYHLSLFTRPTPICVNLQPVAP
jgi:hypothetical protein